MSSALRCACCLQQCPTHRHSLHCHRSSSTNCSGMDSGGFGLCDHRAEGSAALFGDAAAPPTLQPSTHLRCCPEKSISLPSLPSLAQLVRLRKPLKLRGRRALFTQSSSPFILQWYKALLTAPGRGNLSCWTSRFMSPWDR